MILQTNPNSIASKKFAAKRILQLKLQATIERFLRTEFEKANFDYNAQAVIEVAKSTGIDTSEMEVDYALELSRKESA